MNRVGVRGVRLALGGMRPLVVVVELVEGTVARDCWQVVYKML